ncbi:hypothetical protein HNP86_001597 [Methanococcus maripaludis]|uniref:Uncharacterized protein n=1 Tax=Methanococcus maripaludis TaxID=39152 RepID=A0A7J9NW23_METMI|nr:hypothetical protein [Methanococcus maripaludis]MBA2851444.1 hypothetical protein [Methanococcus maripaludis]
MNWRPILFGIGVICILCNIASDAPGSVIPLGNVLSAIGNIFSIGLLSIVGFLLLITSEDIDIVKILGFAGILFGWLEPIEDLVTGWLRSVMSASTLPVDVILSITFFLTQAIGLYIIYDGNKAIAPVKNKTKRYSTNYYNRR